MPQVSPKTALIVGATGAFGLHAAVALLKRGWSVRGLARDPAAAAAKCGAKMPIAWVRGDALNADDVMRAARGVRIIVHAANPSAYRNWAGLVLPMFESTLAAAKAEGARVILPGNVYNYAPDAGAHIGEDAAQTPATRKGAIRVEMEARLEEATRHGAKGLILRAGDFFGPGAAGGGAFAWLLRRRGERATGLFAPGPREIGHAFAYLPDLGEALGRILEREDDLDDFARFHFTGRFIHLADLAQSVRLATARPRLALTPFPWPVVALMSPFNETLRELLEMRYLWRRPIGLANERLTALIGPEPMTPLDIAVEATLADMGIATVVGEGGRPVRLAGGMPAVPMAA